MDQQSVTISLLPERTIAGYRAEVVLYRAHELDEPKPDSSIAVRVDLPPLPEETTIEVRVGLDISDVGKSATDSVNNPDNLQHWSPSIPCDAPLGSNEACVPGGAFWMGNADTPLGVNTFDDGKRERIVVLSPFVIDRSEVTRGEYFASAGTHRLAIDNACAKSEVTTPPEEERLPATCVAWVDANAHCTRRHARLPSEAELEYLKGGLGGFAFPWRTNAVKCGDANYGKDYGGGKYVECPGTPDTSIAGSYPLDALRIGDRTVVDLAGNVAELAADQFEVAGGACWPTGILFDPKCASLSHPGYRSLRGSAANETSVVMRASYRTYVEDENRAVGAHIGFRCARTVK